MKDEAENRNNGTETVTISRTEYDAFTKLKARNEELNRQVQWFLEQVRLASTGNFAHPARKVHTISSICSTKRN